MLSKKTDRLTPHARRIALGVLLCIGWVDTSFAQAEPPLTVPLAGRVPYLATTGCDPGLTASGSLYVTSTGGSIVASPPGQIGANPATVVGSPAAAGAVGSTLPGANPTDNIPLYGTDLNGNAPLYSTPDLGGIFPLYSTPVAGTNLPLYGNSTTGSYAAQTANIGPVGNVPQLRCRSGIPVGQWLLYPSLQLSAGYAQNFFLTATSPLNTAQLGVVPTLLAEWTNGIHSTTIYGTLNGQAYSALSQLNAANPQASFKQKYSPLPDLSFSFAANYLHQTLASGLVNSIPTAINTPVANPTLLPNGDIELPNGNIIAPNGQIVGHVNPVLAFAGTTFINPSNAETVTGSATKILNGGIVTVGGSFGNTNYQSDQGTGPGAFTSTTTETAFENASFAIGPLLYLYSNGTFNKTITNASALGNTNSYDVVVGIGVRQIGLIRSSVYAGYQGSETAGSGSAGGALYGGQISYYPTPDLSFSLKASETTNISSMTTASNLALNLPPNTPVQVALSSSSFTTLYTFEGIYQISPKWTLAATFNYSHIADVGTSNLATNAWLADLQLSYEIWRNMTLAADYQFTYIASNPPPITTMRNLVMLSADYRF